MNELRNRGVEDILLAVIDGLKGFPDAITAVFPDALDGSGPNENISNQPERVTLYLTR